MNVEIDLPVDSVFATGHVEREGIGYYVDGLTVWLDILGKEIAVTVPPEIEQRIRELIVQRYEDHHAMRFADGWEPAIGEDL